MSEKASIYGLLKFEELINFVSKIANISFEEASSKFSDAMIKGEIRWYPGYLREAINTEGNIDDD